MAGRYPDRFNDDSILARYFGRSANYTDIPNYLFNEYNVKKGLRNDDGTGVRIGLTRISDVIGYTNDEKGNVIPCDGDHPRPAAEPAGQLRLRGDLFPAPVRLSAGKDGI